jgi:hypothetical protein
MLFMLWLIVRLLTRILVLSDADDGTKDLEILVLRHQLRVLRRKSGRSQVHCTRSGPARGRQPSAPRQRWPSFLVTPQTLLRWHRMLVRRKWTYGKQRTPGRPPIDPQVAALIVRMARENARWGCVRICGELRKLGIRVGATRIKTLLRRHGLGPAPRRCGPSWAVSASQAEGIVACDFSQAMRPDLALSLAPAPRPFLQTADVASCGQTAHAIHQRAGVRTPQRPPSVQTLTVTISAAAMRPNPTLAAWRT